jgi:hypothetical protein
MLANFQTTKKIVFFEKSKKKKKMASPYPLPFSFLLYAVQSYALYGRFASQTFCSTTFPFPLTDQMCPVNARQR